MTLSPSHRSHIPALSASRYPITQNGQGGILGVRTLLIVGAVAVGAAGLTDAAADDAAAFLGTYVQNAPCKGDGKDDAKKIVKIGEKQVDSNFGPCVFADKQVDGKVIK